MLPIDQRGGVWKEDKASRYLVTVLCSRLSPGVVLREKEKGVFEVVDGKQRLTTLLSFYLAGEDPDLHKILCQGQTEEALCLITTLNKLDETYEELNGLTYNQLSTDRKKAFQSYTMACTVIPLKTNKEEVYSCYEDLNSGGEDLSEQQLRKALYYSDAAVEYMELLHRLAKNEDFQCIREPKAFRNGKYQLCPKEKDRELILRAFAFERVQPKNARKPIKKILNDEIASVDEIASFDQKSI
jgi:hypothetical protein